MYSPGSFHGTKVAVEEQPFSGALRMKLIDFEPNPYNQGLIFESQHDVAQSDVVLLVFYLRSVSDEVVRVGAVPDEYPSGTEYSLMGTSHTHLLNTVYTFWV